MKKNEEKETSLEQFSFSFELDLQSVKVGPENELNIIGEVKKTISKVRKSVIIDDGTSIDFHSRYLYLVNGIDLLRQTSKIV